MNPIPVSGPMIRVSESVIPFPLPPELVCEVAYDRLDGRIFRHPARFRRWRPDLDPKACTWDQFQTYDQLPA